MNPSTQQTKDATPRDRREFFAATGRWLAGGALATLAVAQGYKYRHLARGNLCWKPTQCEDCLAANSCPKSSAPPKLAR